MEPCESTVQAEKISSDRETCVKAGFHMIADDRGSQIADRRRSQRQLFPYNRGRSQSRLLPTFRSAEVSKLQALYAGGKIASKQHGRR